MRQVSPFSSAVSLLLAAWLAGCGGAGGGAPAGGDTTAPTVASTAPADGATGVAAGAEISATFSEPLACATAAAAFTLADEAAVAGTVGCSGARLTFTPSAPLGWSTAFTATVTTAVTDAAGNHLAAQRQWRFTTMPPPDTAPPTLLSTVPAGGATGVAWGSTVTATFSEPMAAASLASAFTLATAGGAPVDGSVGTAGAVATFTPSAPLAAGTDYRATITVAAQDLAGNGLATEASWTFRTADPPPAGPFIVFEKNGDLFSVPEAGGPATTISATAMVEDVFLGVSPTGRVAYRVGAGELWARALDGSGAEHFATGMAGVTALGFSTTGRFIFESGNDLHSAALDGSATRTQLTASGTVQPQVLMASGGRLVYLDGLDADRAVKIIGDAGAGGLTLDGSAGLKVLDALGPTGVVYYEVVTSGGLGEAHALWSAALDGGGAAAVTGVALRYELLYAIAPDGTLVLSYCELLNACDDSLLTVVPAPAAPDATFPKNLQRGSPRAVTPDNRLVYDQGVLGALDLYAVATTGGAAVALETVAGVNETFQAFHAASGRTIYRAVVGSQGMLYSVGATEGDTVRLGTGTDTEYLLGVAPGGRVVYTAVPSAGPGESYYSVNADGTGRQLLVAATSGLLFAGFSSSGKVLYVDDDGASKALHAVGHDGAAPVTLTSTSSYGVITYRASVP